MNRLKFTDLRTDTPEKSSTKLISVMSGKGGVGKSIISLAIAEQLASSSHRVLVIDVDLGCGNQHILANVNAKFGLGEVIDGALTIKQAITSITTNIDLLASSPSHAANGELDMATSTKLARALREQASHYDFLVLDHASGISNAQLNLASHSDEILLVIVPELTSISDGYSLHKRIIESGSSALIRLTVNRAASKMEANYIRDKFNALSEQFVGAVPIWSGSIPEDDSIRQSVARQKRLSEISSESTAYQAFGHLASCIKRGSSIDFSPNPEMINKNRPTADIKG